MIDEQYTNTYTFNEQYTNTYTFNEQYTYTYTFFEMVMLISIFIIKIFGGSSWVLQTGHGMKPLI